MTTSNLSRFPCVVAFERGDELALWFWTYRVWNGWRMPKIWSWNPYGK